RDDQPVGVDHPLGRTADPADLDDPPAFDADIGAKARQTGAVHHRAILDYEIERHPLPPALSPEASEHPRLCVNPTRQCAGRRAALNLPRGPAYLPNCAPP